MDYISVIEAAEKWNLSERRVRGLCSEGRVEGAERHGNWAWSIPADIERPSDGRSLRFTKGENFTPGHQNYNKIENAKTKGQTKEKQEKAIIATLSNIVYFEKPDFDLLNIEKILSGNFIEGIPLFYHVQILNEYSQLNELDTKISVSSLRTLNLRILNSVDNKQKGQFRSNLAEKEFKGLMLQYKNNWSSLHTLTRASFLFGGLMKIKPFLLANEATAWIAFQTELKIGGYPIMLLNPKEIDEVKASLISARIRGNYQKLISLFCDSF